MDKLITMESAYDIFRNYFSPVEDDTRSNSQRQAERDRTMYDYIAKFGRLAFDQLHYSVMCDISDLRVMDRKLAEIVYDR